MVRKTCDDESDRKLIDDIATYGWHCVRIAAEENLPCFAFTVGVFHSYQHPEFIIFGLRSDIAHRVLTLAIDGMRSGAIFDLALPTDELLNGYPCVFIRVPEAEYFEHVGFGRWFYEGNDFPLYQIVWPSRAGLFPWHPDASEAFRAEQPVLGHRDAGI